MLQGHYDNIIEYVSSDNYVYQSAFAEYITDQTHQRAPQWDAFLETLLPVIGFCAVFA